VLTYAAGAYATGDGDSGGGSGALPSGTLSAPVGLTGTLHASAPLTGTLTTPVGLSATLLFTGTLTGTLTATVGLSGTLQAGGQMTGTISLPVGLTADLLFDRGLVAWDLDKSQRFNVTVGLTAILVYFPAPVAPPVGLVQVPTRRVSLTMPVPTLDPRGRAVNWTPTSKVDIEWGRLQLVVGSVDLTFLRDVPAIIERWEDGEPFGDTTASVRLPQVSEFEALGVGDRAALVGGAQAHLRLVRPDGSTLTLWSGQLVSPEGNRGEREQDLGLQWQGALYQADWSRKPPSFDLAARDIGDVIAETLNGYESRDYGHCVAVVTGITTRSRGAWTPRLSGYVQDLLATATDSAGGQYTVAQEGRIPVVRLKDRTTVHATFTIGSPGISDRLESDLLAGANVIFGEGTDVDGCRWRNTKYPNLRTDDAPVYPLAAGSTFTAGSSTAGFAPFADELRLAGYTMASGNTYSSPDVAEVRDAQARAGINVDGIVGPQTWAAIFQTGSDGGDLSGAYFAPIAADSRVMPRLYNAKGADIGPNPAFLPDLPRIERFINYGEGVSKNEGAESANADLARDAAPGWYGTVTFRADPQELSRFELKSGMNLLAKSHRGADRMLHIAQRSVDWQSQTVTCQVDSKARDRLTLAGLRSRNKDAAQDPGRRVSTQGRSSRNVSDSTSVFDCESGAGVVPRHALFRGLWTVLRIPAGQVGSIARTEFQTDSATTSFALGIFSKPVTANLLKSLVGNPLSGARPWNTSADELLDAGILEAWGSQTEPCGYYPGALSEGDGLTGRFFDGAAWSYESAHPPYLWVAEYAPVSCFISGRLFAAVG